MIVLQAKQIAESGFHFVWFDVLNSQRGLNTYIDLNSLANNLATIYMLAFVCKVELLKATTPYRKFFEATGSTAMKVRLFSDADPSNFRPDSRSGKNIPLLHSTEYILHGSESVTMAVLYISRI